MVQLLLRSMQEVLLWLLFASSRKLFVNLQRAARKRQFLDQ